MDKFTSFESISIDLMYEEFFDENGEKHLDNRFLGITDKGFAYCDSTIGEIFDINLYDLKGSISFEKFCEDWEIK